MFEPTVHDHCARPLPSAVTGPSPFAVLGPLLYVTVMEHAAPGTVATTTCAVPPRDTGLRTLTKDNDAGRGVAGAAMELVGATGARDAGAVDGAGVVVDDELPARPARVRSSEEPVLVPHATKAEAISRVRT